MSTTRSKATKTKSNSHKKLRKTMRETEVEDNAKLSAQCNIGIETIENKKVSSEHPARKSDRDTSICKSLENIMNLKHTSHDTISMSKTDISIVYGMYKTLIQKHNVANEIHMENYQNLLNELHKFENRFNEQDQRYKLLVNLVTALPYRHRIDRRMRMKDANKLNRMMMTKFSQITSVVCNLQRSIESLEAKNFIFESNIEKCDVATTTDVANLQKKKKKSIFCSCM